MQFEQFSLSQKKYISRITISIYNFLTASQGIDLLSTGQKLFNDALMLSVCVETSFERIY